MCENVEKQTVLAEPLFLFTLFNRELIQISVHFWGFQKHLIFSTKVDSFGVIFILDISHYRYFKPVKSDVPAEKFHEN